MTTNPDPTIQVTSLAGTTRTLDDWLTMFHLCLVVVPDDPAAARFVPVAENIFRVLGDADCRTAVCFPSTAPVAKRVLGPFTREALVFVDPEKALVRSLGLERLPAFVHLRQDTTLVRAAEGWDPGRWQEVADELARAMDWSAPQVDARTVPQPGVSWPAA